MAILHHIRKKKMDLMRLVFSLVFLLNIAILPIKANAATEVLKTINLSMPTNYGTFFGEIHYSEKDLAIALKVERIIKENLTNVIDYFEYVPYDTVHFNIDPYLRQANGNARPFPTNIINLYNFPSSNLEHLVVMENWLQGLVVHEFMHIVHLDQTRGYLKLGRNIFGTIAKVPAAIVPRWFTEGIAVWGESHLMNGGRLNNQLFNKELLIEFKKHDFCKTIDCLDEPGNYPGGELAYWAGAHFMEYLENLKPKTIKCLVEENSQAIPFFLNNAFEKCAGAKAQDLFIKFRDEFSSKELPIPAERPEWGTKINNFFGVDDYQKGLVLDGDLLFRVEHDKKSEALVAYDLKNEVSYLGRYEYPIVDVSSIVAVNNEEKMLLVSFNEDFNFRNQNKVWKLINPETLLVERTIDFLHDPSYVVALGGDDFITFSYWENKWIAERNNNLLYTFSTDNNISLVKRIGDQLLLKINDSYGNSSLVVTDFKFQKLAMVYKSSKVYDLPLITDKFLVIREGAELKLLEWTNSGFQITKLADDLFNQITFAHLNENRVLVLENRLKSSEMKISDAVAIIKKRSSKPVAVVVEEFKSPAGPKESFASQKAEFYPRLDHVIPHYWFLAVGNSENLGSIGAMTTFVDPMEIHFMNATGLVYPEVKKVGGSLDYVQKMVKVSDLWKVRAFARQEYSKTDFNPKTNSTGEFIARTYYSVLRKRWTYTPGMFAGYSKIEDFISERSSRNIGFSQSLIFQAMSYDDFFQSLVIGVNLQANKANTGNSYLASQLTGEAIGRFTQRLSVVAKGSYDKLYKSDFTRGIVYGGGMTDFVSTRIHEFYGVPYSNAYGNTIVTARFMVDYNFLDVYRGKNMIPFFLKEAHLLLGRESMYADRIILDGMVLKEKMINAFFIGPRLKMNLFYYLPSNIDLIYSSIAHPNGKNVDKIDFTISAGLF